MARSVNEEEYTKRRNEILDVARRLVYTKGYEQMAIQDILDALKISKGAFYHYFDSKQALLEALVERLIDEAGRILTPIAEDPDLTALEKFRRYFSVAGRWKTAQKDFMLALLRVWYDDNNAIVRQKMFAEMTKLNGPILAAIIRQGVLEGTLSTRFPDQASEIIFTLFQGLSDTFVSLFLLARETGQTDIARIETLFAACNEAVERILGAPAGSLPLVDPAIIEEWFAAPQDDHAENVAIAEPRAV